MESSTHRLLHKKHLKQNVAIRSVRGVPPIAMAPTSNIKKEGEQCNGSAMFTPAQSHSQTLLEHYDYAIVCI